MMNTKKLIVFLLWAFLPMVIVGVVMLLSGASTDGLSEDSSAIDPFVVIKGIVLSAGAMFTPLLAVIFTQLIYKEPVLKHLGISFKINRWWWLGWLENKGSTSGSRVKFYNAKDKNSYIMHKPHPSNVIKGYLMRDILNFLLTNNYIK